MKDIRTVYAMKFCFCWRRRKPMMLDSVPWASVKIKSDDLIPVLSAWKRKSNHFYCYKTAKWEKKFIVEARQQVSF